MKKVIEILSPDLDHYRRPMRKGRVVATYPSDGRYVCDVQILLNNEQPDENEPLINGVEIPVIWGGKNRGIICPPSVGTLCDVDYYHGDPNYPRISNFRWQENGAPAAAVDELIIQQTDGVYIRVKPNNDIEVKTPAAINAEAGGIVTVKTPAQVIVDAPLSIFMGEVIVEGLLTYQSGLAGTGVSNISGALKASTINSDTVSLDSHTHGGVEGGNKSTGMPQ